MRRLLFVPLVLFLSFCTPEEENKLNASGEKLVEMHQGRSADPKTLDPQAQFDSQSNIFVASIYDTLLDYHYLKRPYELEPSLLESMPVTSKDGKTMTFKLKEGVHFHDNACFPGGKGRELTSDDVLYTIKRFADINVNTLSWFLLSGVVEGLDAFRERTKKEREIDYDKVEIPGLVKVDKYQFKIKLKQKNPLALYSLAASSVSIVPKEAVKKYGRAFARNPVGTGPFQLKKYMKKQTMVFEKNEKYFRSYPVSGTKEDKEKGFLADAGKKLPLVDRIYLHYTPESQPEMLKFKRGELAWIALDRDNFEQIAFFDKSGEMKLNKEVGEDFRLYSEPALISSYLVFNMKNETVQNKNLRFAIAHALDINRKIELLNNGRGIKLQTFVPPAIAGSQRDIGNYGTDYDLKKAKQYLKAAGYPEGKTPVLTLTIGGTGTSHQNQFEFYRNALDAIGITLKPDYKTWPSYLTATEVGDFQMAASAWQADYPDAENFYQLLYGPNKHSSNFDNPEYNKLYEEMRFMENSPERFEVMKKMAKILQDEKPVVFDNTPIASGLVQNWVKNFKRNMMVNYSFKYLNLEDPQDKKFL